MESKNERAALQIQKNFELKKHVAVIHSSNKLSLLQRKIANALLFNAYKELHQKDEHTIHIAKLCELIGYDSHDHKSIKRALVNLISTVLEWNLVDGERLDKEGVWNASSIIAGASINGAICTYSYSSQMRKLLYRPNMYGRLDLLIQARFQSTYGLALYENCNRFQDIGQTPWFNLLKFRKLMGVEDGKYKIFRDFKTRVLDKAVEEVNKYSSLIISPQLRKENRQVTSIQFLIKSNVTMPAAKSTNSLKNNELIDVLRSQFGFSTKQIFEMMRRYEDKYISEKIDIVLSSLNFKNGKIKNLTRYLQSALRDDYQATKESKVTKSIKSAHQSHKPDVMLLTQFKRFQENQLMSLFNGLFEKDRLNILKQFEKFLTGMYAVVYLRDGLKNLLVQEQLCEFLKKTNHELITQLISYDLWQKESCGNIRAITVSE